MKKIIKEISLRQVKQALKNNFKIRTKALVRLSGYYDQNYKAKAARTDYFLKIYGHDSAAIVRYQVELIEYLQKHLWPVAPIIPNLKGQKLFSIDKRPAVLQEFLKGRHLDNSKMSPKLAYDIGSKLGLMHKLTGNKKFPGKGWKKYFWDFRQFDLIVANYPKVKKLYSLQTKALIEKVIAEWQKKRKVLNKLQVGYIHNDFHGKNLLIIGQKLVGIVDFGDSLQSWLATDLAIPIMHIFLVRKNGLVLIKAFIKGYKSIYSLPKLDFQQASLFVKMRAASLLVGIPLEHGNNPQVYLQGFYRHSLYILKYLQDEAKLEKLDLILQS